MVPTNPTEIERVVREYYEQMHANRLDNLNKMDKFLKTQKPSKMTQEGTANLNRPITSLTDSVI